MKIKPANNNILVNLKLRNESDNGFIIEDEFKGDGAIVKCIYLGDVLYKPNTILYIPFYALRQLTNDIYVCEKESVVAYESE